MSLPATPPTWLIRAVPPRSVDLAPVAASVSAREDVSADAAPGAGRTVAVSPVQSGAADADLGSCPSVGERPVPAEREPVVALELDAVRTGCVASCRIRRGMRLVKYERA